MVLQEPAEECGFAANFTFEMRAACSGPIGASPE